MASTLAVVAVKRRSNLSTEKDVTSAAEKDLKAMLRGRPMALYHSLLLYREFVRNEMEWKLRHSASLNAFLNLWTSESQDDGMLPFLG